MPVATAGPGAFGRRIEVAVSSLLTPVVTLLTDLGLVAGRREDGFPGSCVNGVCTSSSDIPVPQPQVDTIFINLTGKPLTLSNLSTNDPLAYGPQNGYVLGNARQVEMGFYKNNDEDTSTRGTMTWSDGTTSVSIYVTSSGASATPSNTNLQSDVFNTPTPVTGPSQIPVRQTVLFLPKAGTTITIDPSDAVGQAIIATALCGNRGSCTQEAVSETIEFSDYKNVGNTVFNYGSVNSTNSYEVAHEAVKTNGIEENLKVAAGGSLKFTLGPLNFETEISAVLQAKYGHSWSSGVMTRQGATVTVAPGKYGQIQVSYAEYHDKVDMTLTDKSVTIVVPDIEYVSPVPDGAKYPDGTPVPLPSWRTVDYDIGTGPNPYPNSSSTPTAPTNTSPPVTNPTPPDIAVPAPAPAPTRKSLGVALTNFVEDEVQAVLNLPNVLFGDGSARGGATDGFEVVNLTPYPQQLWTIYGEYDAQRSPAAGYILQPYQMIRVEVDYDLFGGADAVVVWRRYDGGPTTESKATLVTYGDGGTSVECNSNACMDGGEDELNSAEVMYIIQPSPSTFDLTADPNLASAAVDAACYYDSAGNTPGSCSANVTGQSYYTQPLTSPSNYYWNDSSQPGSYTYQLTLSKSETDSWSAGGGIKIKEKSSLFVGQQIELEATTLYTGSTQVKDSEFTTVKQNVDPYSTGTMTEGDALLRTYGDFIVNLPNSTVIVRNQWLENAAGLAAQGPVISLDDYPGPPQV